MAFSRILVANRGEIALRVMRTANEMGYRTVAVHSDADQDAPHVAFADDAVRIGPPPVGESYLDIDRVLQAARSSGADAVHPGYGFLSERESFARACAEAGIAEKRTTARPASAKGARRIREGIAKTSSFKPCRSAPARRGIGSYLGEAATFCNAAEM